MAAVDDDLDALHARLLAEGAGNYLAQVDELKRLVALGDPGVAAKVHAIAAMARAGDAIDLGAVTRAVQDAYVASVLDNGAIVGPTASERAIGTIAQHAVTPPPVPVDHLGTRAYDAATKALRLLAAGVDPNLAAALILGNGLKTRTALNELLMSHHAQGAADVAVAVRKPVVWVAERNACVRCLAHSGHVVHPGDNFPAGLSFGPYSYDDATTAPPLHPHCRCHLEVLNDASYAEALQREARRSVLRGYSLESESMGVRIHAARELLASGVDAPKSVQAYAARAVKNGEFPTRIVPKVRQTPPDQPRHTPPPAPPTPPKPPTAPRTPPTPPPAPTGKVGFKAINEGPYTNTTGAYRVEVDGKHLGNVIQERGTWVAYGPDGSVLGRGSTRSAAADHLTKRQVMPTPPVKPPVAPPAPPVRDLERERKLAETKAELARVKAERARLAALQAEADRALAAKTKAGKGAPLDLTKAKTPKDMAALAQARHPGTDFSRWTTTTGLNAGQSRSAIQTVSDMLDRFPGAKLTSMSPGLTPQRGVSTAGVMAWVRTPILREEYVNGIRTKVYDKPSMEVALGHIRSEAKHNEAVQRSSDSGHFHEVKGEDAMRYTITHEFGHVLDSNSGWQLSTMWEKRFEAEASKHGPNGSRARYDWRKDQMSKYATKNSREAVAEAFADVEYNGAKALPLNRAFHEAAMEWLKMAGMAK